jgi:hypothetical protein
MGRSGRYTTILSKEYTHNSITQTGYTWVKQLKIGEATFAKRIKRYGENDKRVFYTTEEMKQYIKKYKEEHKGTEKGKSSKRWIQDKDKLCDPLDYIKLAKDSLSVQASIDLVTCLIEDAKGNLLPRRNGKKSPYFIDSKRWLMNGNGGLKYLLEYVPGLNVEESLRELREYAEKFE